MKVEVMAWLAFLTLVALSFLVPKARTYSLSALGLAVIAIVAIVVFAKRGEPPTPGSSMPPTIEQKPVDFEKFLVDKLDRADPAAKTRIPLTEIRFDQVQAEAGAERGSVDAVVARIYNDSVNYTLTDYGYYLAVQDCIKEVCTTVFDQRGLSAISVPPHQARDVRIAVSDGRSRGTPSIKIFGTAKILLTPTTTRAQPAAGGSSD